MPPLSTTPRHTNKGVKLTDFYVGGESDTLREIPPEFRAALQLIVEETPVPNDQNVEPLDGNLILASKVFTKQTGEKFRRSTKKPAGNITLFDQEYDKKYDVIIPSTRTFQPQGTGIGQAHTQVKDLGNKWEIADSVDVSAVAAFLGAYQAVVPGRVRVEFPPVLQSVQLVFQSNAGDGNAQTVFAFGQWSGSGSYSLPIHQEAQGSSVAMPEFVEVMAPERGTHRYLPTRKVTFFLPKPVSDAQVFTKLSTILGVSVVDWPQFNPQELVAVLGGQHNSGRVTADYHYQDGGSQNGHEHAEVGAKGFSKEVGVTVKTTRVRASIHGDVSGGLVGAFTPVPISLSAQAASIVSTLTLDSAVPSWNVFNTGATPGDITIPTSGVRLLRCESEMYEYGFVMIMCETLDFAKV